MGPTAVSPWVLEWGTALGTLAFLIVGVMKFRRDRRLSIPLLLCIASMTTFWQETFGDWGAYMIWSPDLHQMTWIPSPISHTSPNRPWAIIPIYGVWFASFFLLTLIIARRLQNHVARWHPVMLTALVGTVIWCIFEVVLEGATTALGWWSYEGSIGPALDFGNGKFPLIYPMLEQIPYMVGIPCLLAWRDDRGRLMVERVFSKVKVGWRRETARMAGWSVALNVILLVTCVGPLVLVRELWGAPSQIVP